MERGQSSIEKVTQEEREKSVLGAVYVSVAQIPDCPLELSSTGVQSPDGAKPMTLGAGFQDFLNHGNPVASITDLLGQISNPSMGGHNSIPFQQQQQQSQSVPHAHFNNKTPEQADLLSMLSNDQVAQLLQQLNSAGSQNLGSGSASDSTWNQIAQNGAHVEGDNSWQERGLRGRGRGRGAIRGRGKRRPCTFFAEGR